MAKENLRKSKILGYIFKYISHKFLKAHRFSALKHIKQEILIMETKSSETLNYTIVHTQFNRILIYNFIE